ncbi:MAG: hypothetical protein ACOYO1_12640 [Bacteroidales bacterium]
MKKLVLLSIFCGGFYFCSPVFSQYNSDSYETGLAGDNLNLYGVLNLFQESETLEAFEQKLNVEDSKINNLDLDGDGKTDYIRVIDNINGNSHTIVLQDVINKNESQDVAVIEVGRDQKNQIQIQIIGDEQLYGKDYIIEPVNGTPNPGYKGNSNVSPNGNTTVVNNNYYDSDNRNGNRYAYRHASTWSIIRFIFAPSYVVYVSPWRWEYYPTYWRPWHQMHYNDYYGHWNKHQSHNYYHHSHTYNVPSAHTYYGPRRTSSPMVHQKIERGEYKRESRQINTDSKRNNTFTPDKKREINNDQFKGVNRRTDADINRGANQTIPSNNNRVIPSNNNNNRVVPSNNNNNNRIAPSNNNNNRITPSNNNRVIQNERPARNTDTRINERKTEKPAARPEIKQDKAPEVRQEMPKDGKRR